MSAISQLDSIGGLVALVAAVDAGGFAGAGRKLGVSASAVGKAVSRLEQRHGVRLLERTTRSIALTDEGATLYARSARILDDLHDAESALSQARKKPFGRVKISLPTILGRKVVLPMLGRFLAEFPEVQVDLWLEDRCVDIIEEGYDLAVRLGNLEDSALVARRLAPLRIVTCGAPAYFARRGVPNSPTDLRHHDCIRFRFPSSGRLHPWSFATGTLPRTVGGLILNEGEALAVAAAAGLGIAQMPTFLAAEYLADGRLRSVLEEETRPRGDIWLLWPAGRTDLPRVREVAKFVSSLIA